jgi:transglutaminase-like putative cysteine protease
MNRERQARLCTAALCLGLILAGCSDSPASGRQSQAQPSSRPSTDHSPKPKTAELAMRTTESHPASQMPTVPPKQTAAKTPSRPHPPAAPQVQRPPSSPVRQPSPPTKAPSLDSPNPSFQTTQRPAPNRPSWGVLPDDDAPSVPSGAYHYDGRTAETDQIPKSPVYSSGTSRSEVEKASDQRPSRLAWQGQLPADLERVDDFAGKAPSSLTGDYRQLAGYLKGAGPSALHQLRAIYAWEAYNIEYDIAVLQGGKPTTSQHPPDVLKNRKAVCDGFARLYVVLAQEMGLQVEHVLGEAQSDGHGLVLGSGDNLHRWIRAKVENSDQNCWVLIDPTWGRSKQSNGDPTVNPHYFCLEPAEFLKGHFPRDSRWQLMNPPLSHAAWSNHKGGKSGKIKLQIKLERAR